MPTTMLRAVRRTGLTATALGLLALAAGRTAYADLSLSIDRTALNGQRVRLFSLDSASGGDAREFAINGLSLSPFAARGGPRTLHAPLRGHRRLAGAGLLPAPAQGRQGGGLMQDTRST